MNSIIFPFAAGGTGGDWIASTSSAGSGVFVGGDGSVTAPLRIANFIKDPCLSAIVDKIIDANLGDNISKSFFSIFNKNEKMNLFFSENTNLERPGGFQVTHPSLDVTNYNIYLNLSKMQNSSDEYKANVIVHEIAHAIIRSLYTDENVYKALGFDGRHYIMLQNYVSQMKTFLEGNLNLREVEAMSMILTGLADLNTGITDSALKNKFNEDFVKIVNSYNFSLMYGDYNYLYNYNEKHMNGFIGTKNCPF